MRDKTFKDPGVLIPNEQRAAYLEHMRWFIENLPESRFVATFHIDILQKYDKESYRKFWDLYLAQTHDGRADVDILVNAGVALSDCDKKASRSLAKVIAKRNPAWAERIRLLLGHKIAPVDVDKALNNHQFKPGKRSTRLASVSKTIDITRRMIDLRRLPLRTIWSHERALERNPNDTLLRGAALEAYDAFDQFSVYFGGHTPDVASDLLRHSLWFIQHTPDYRLYSLGCHLDLSSTPGRSYLGPHAILLEAAERQMDAYPKNLTVCLGLESYYALGLESEYISRLKAMQKLYPRNAAIASRLRQKHSLLDRRTSRRFEFLDHVSSSRKNAKRKTKPKPSRRGRVK